MSKERKHTKSCFCEKKKKTGKESLTKVYKDSKMWRKVIDRENKGTSKTNEEFKRAKKKRWKKRENTEGPKKENKWIEDEQKERVKRQSRRSKRERVALVEVKVKSFFFWEKKRKFQKKPTQIFNEKMNFFFVMKWKKQEVREKTVSFFFFLKKKKETAKTEIVQKNVLFGMTGRYVKGENKWQKKDS